MDTLSRIGFLPNCCYSVQFPRIPSSSRFPCAFPSPTTPLLSVLRAGPPSVSGIDEDVLQTFFKERELNGDFISRASDLLWRRNFRNSVDSDISKLADSTPQQTEQIIETNSDGGFLKLSSTQEWLLGDNSAPINKKVAAKMLQDSSERRKKLNMLRYESLKQEILLLSVGIGLACSGYCLITLSVQAAVSYVIGVLFRRVFLSSPRQFRRRQKTFLNFLGEECLDEWINSCLYLQLLYQYADNLSSEAVPEIFRKKKPKKIGIRSEDLQDALERSIKGTSISLSSPRLVIPASIFGLWILSHRYFINDFFDFQIVPAMFGMFVYKAAVLVQVYRDNEDLQFVFPENEDESSG